MMKNLVGALIAAGCLVGFAPRADAYLECVSSGQSSGCTYYTCYECHVQGDEFMGSAGVTCTGPVADGANCNDSSGNYGFWCQGSNCTVW